MGARHIGFGKETVYGTRVAPTRFFEVLSESLKVERTFDTPPVIRSYSAQEMVELTSLVKGEIELLANYGGMGLLFEYLLGDVVTTGAGDPYTHTFPGSGGIPSTDRIGLSLSGEVRRDGALNWRYGGLKITSLKQRFGIDQASRVSLSVLGANADTSASPATPTYPALEAMYPKHVTVSFDGSPLKARSAEITIENPLDEPALLGSVGLAMEPDRNGPLKVTASVEVLFDSLTQYAKFDGATNVDAVIKADSGTHELTYNLKKARLTQATPAVSGRDRLVATYTLESIFNTVATENIEVILLNADASA